MATVRKRTWTSGGEEKTAWIVDYNDQDGTRRLKTFGKKKDADAWKDATQVDIRQGVHTAERASITVAEAGENWITEAEHDGLERATIREYRTHLDQHILPYLAQTKLADLSVPTVASFRSMLLGSGRSQAMTKKILASLGSLLAVAQVQGRVNRNTVREFNGQRRKRGRHTKRDKRRLEMGVDIPTKDELRAILTAAEGKWRPLIVTMIFTGLRASELRGLTWAGADFDSGVLRVMQRADRFNDIGSPKSDAGKRDVPMAPIVANTLKELKLSRENADNDALVFPNGAGNVETLANIHRRCLGTVQKAAGICVDADRPKYSAHKFRHAAASLFIDQGMPPKRVQAIMGHETIQLTLDTYGHLFPDDEGDQKAMEAIEARLLA